MQPRHHPGLFLSFCRLIMGMTPDSGNGKSSRSASLNVGTQMPLTVLNQYLSATPILKSVNGSRAGLNRHS